jgi:small subunit ribosomal protein S1
MVNSNNSISKEQSNGEKVNEKAPAEKAVPQKAARKEEDVGFRELYEQSLQSVQLGQIVTGKVVQINSDVLMVDVGWKTKVIFRQGN